MQILSVSHQNQKTKSTKRKWVPKNRYKRQIKKKKHEKQSVVFNYSDLELTADMTTLLNRGLNFAIQPMKLNMTELLVNFQKFQRTIMWVEYWTNQEKDEDDDEYKEPIFKKKKTNLPSNPSPEVKTFLAGVLSELKDPLNRNNCRPNLPPGELKALSELIRLQREE